MYTLGTIVDRDGTPGGHDGTGHDDGTTDVCLIYVCCVNHIAIFVGRAMLTMHAVGLHSDSLLIHNEEASITLEPPCTTQLQRHSGPR